MSNNLDSGGSGANGAGMRRFLLMCSLFGTLITLTLIACELLVRREVPNPYKYKHEYLSRHSDRVSTLVLGSSHAYYGIAPSALGDSAFNLADVSQLYSYDLRLLRHYPFPNLRTVILPVSYFSFTDPRLEDSSEWDLLINYKIYMDIDDHGDVSIYNFELSHPAVFTRKLRALIERKPLSCDSLGFGLDYSREARSAAWEESGPKAAARHTAASPEALGENVRAFRGIAGYCREHGVRLMLVTTPAWRTYREHVDPRQYAEMMRQVRALQRDYDVEYHDFLSDPSFVSDDFFDGDHLNSDGARKFSRRLRALMDSVR